MQSREHSRTAHNHHYRKANNLVHGATHPTGLGAENGGSCSSSRGGVVGAAAQHTKQLGGNERWGGSALDKLGRRSRGAVCQWQPSPVLSFHPMLQPVGKEGVDGEIWSGGPTQRSNAVGHGAGEVYPRMGCGSGRTECGCAVWEGRFGIVGSRVKGAGGGVIREGG